MVSIEKFTPVMIQLPAIDLPIVGLEPGMKLVGHNLPTNHMTLPVCLIEFNGYVREHVLFRVSQGYEPSIIPERIACLTKLEKFDPETALNQS
ncbi:MAG TPA: hypothetical protein VK742_20455 [Candidatus Sulfotelmatobacter sp.]|nr:hypothetical protein [Candidatus Sulfotelmatobacter sp.]